MRGLLTKASVAVSVLLTGLLAVPSPSQAACGEFHRIARGETLRSITIRHYRHDRYQVLFAANRDILRNPAEIEVGQLLYLPCPETGPQTRLDAVTRAKITPSRADQLGTRLARIKGRGDVTVVTPDSVHVPEPAAQAPRDRLVLSGSGFAPLTDETLDAGGLIAKLVMTALAEGAPRVPNRLAFVNDWKAHLPTLMPTGAFSLAFPWPKPDCRDGGAGPASRSVCDAFVFSRPLYEVPVSIWVRRGSPLERSAALAEFAGMRLCRPGAFPPFDLETAGVPMGIVTARNTAACADDLLAGAVDAVSVPQPLEAALKANPTYATQLVQVPGLTRSVPLHALAWRASVDAVDTIAALDRGLAGMQASGEWFKIVSQYLSAYNRRLAQGN